MSRGRSLGERYLLEDALGRGGMGEVWRAVDLRLNRPVAVKILPVADETDAALLARFRREAELAARLQHPGITVVHDTGRDDGLLYLVMELLDGEDLRKVLARHPGGLPLDHARSITAQVASALHAAHAGGVVHRDVKPSNLIEVRGGWTKVCDFGVARLAESATGLTAGASPGTPVYMAPEQIEGAAVDGRTDLYSLGCVLYELLTGRPPFLRGLGLPALFHHHLSVAPPDPRGFRPDVPADLAGLLRDLLAKDPAARPADGETVVRRLRPEQRPEQRAEDGPEPSADARQRTGLDLFERGDYAGALPVFQQVFAERTRLLGHAHEETLTSGYLVAASLYYLDREPEALPLAQGILAGRTHALGPEHPATLNVHHLVCSILTAQGRYAEALPALLYVTDGRARVLGPYHEDAVDSRCQAALALSMTGRGAEAYGLLAEVWGALARLYGPADPRTRQCQEMMAAITRA